MLKKTRQQITTKKCNLQQSLITDGDSLSTASFSLNQEKSENSSQKSKISNLKQGKNKKFSWPVFKKFFSYTLVRWRLGLLGLVATLLTGFISSIIPYQVGVILDYVATNKDNQNPNAMGKFHIQLLEFLIVIILLGIVTYLRTTAMQHLQQLLAMDMKTDIYSKFIKNDMYFFQLYKSGQLVSRLGTDINQAKSAVSNNLTFLTRNLVTIIANLIVLFILSLKLTLAVMIVVPFYVIVTVYYNKRFKPLVVQYQDIMAEQSAHVGEKFSSIELVKAYQGEQAEIQKYNDLNLKAYEVAKKRIFVNVIYMTFTIVLPTLGIFIVLWYGGRLAIQGNAQLTPGGLTSFIMYCTYLTNATSNISDSYANIINGTSAVKKVFEMLSYQPKVVESHKIQNPISGQISFKNVQFTYPSSSVQIFSDLSFRIRDGQYVGFVGKSGSGKSTIIKLIQNYYKIQNGKIFFGNMDSQFLTAGQIRSQIGLVNQEATIFSGTIQENIAYGLENYTYQDLKRAALEAGCWEFINNPRLFPNGFKSVLSEKGSNLSGGQRQRISIARALIRRPKIIIFDEATSALDANSQKMVQQSIEKLAHAQNHKITIIVIAHRLSTIINADRIIAMKQGKIIEQGTHQQLKLKKGYYYSLVEKQLQEN